MSFRWDQACQGSRSVNKIRGSDAPENVSWQGNLFKHFWIQLGNLKIIEDIWHMSGDKQVAWEEISLHLTVIATDLSLLLGIAISD